MQYTEYDLESSAWFVVQITLGYIILGFGEAVFVWYVTDMHGTDL
jgi:hypothetical protein